MHTIFQKHYRPTKKFAFQQMSRAFSKMFHFEDMKCLLTLTNADSTFLYKQQGGNLFKLAWTGILGWSPENIMIESVGEERRIKHFTKCVIRLKIDRVTKDVDPPNWPPNMELQWVPASVMRNFADDVLKHCSVINFEPALHENIDYFVGVMSHSFGMICLPPTDNGQPQFILLVYYPEYFDCVGFLLRNSSAATNDLFASIRKYQRRCDPIHIQHELQSTAKEYAWKGNIEWQVSTNSNEIKFNVECAISKQVNDLKPEENPSMWPSKLKMEIIPKLHMVHFSDVFLRNAKMMKFYPTSDKSLNTISKTLSNANLGLIMFSTAEEDTTCQNLTLLVVFYHPGYKEYLVLLPCDQAHIKDQCYSHLIDSLSAHKQFARSSLCKKIWSGKVEFMEYKRGFYKVKHTIGCQIIKHFHSENLPFDFEPINWPIKLTLKLLPMEVLSTIVDDIIDHSSFIQLAPQYGISHYILANMMSFSTGGCVFLSPAPGESRLPCNTKVFLLIMIEYDVFLGLIPNDQIGILTILKAAILKAKLNLVPEKNVFNFPNL